MSNWSHFPTGQPPMNLPGENPPPSDNLYVKGLPGMEGMSRNSWKWWWWWWWQLIINSIATIFLIVLFHIISTLFLSMMVTYQKTMVMICHDLPWYLLSKSCHCRVARCHINNSCRRLGYRSRLRKHLRRSGGHSVGGPSLGVLQVAMPTKTPKGETCFVVKGRPLPFFVGR